MEDREPSIANSSKPAPNLQVESHQIRTSLIIGNHKHVLRHACRAIYQRFVGVKSAPSADLHLKNFSESIFRIE